MRLCFFIGIVLRIALLAGSDLGPSTAFAQKPVLGATAVDRHLGTERVYGRLQWPEKKGDGTATVYFDQNGHDSLRLRMESQTIEISQKEENLWLAQTTLLTERLGEGLFFSRRGPVLRLYANRAQLHAAPWPTNAVLTLRVDSFSPMSIHHHALPSVRMTDNFMRTRLGFEDAWFPESGWWRILHQEHLRSSPNPFIALGSATAESGKLLAGHLAWNHYDMSVSFMPEGRPDLGLIFGHADDRHYLRAEISSDNNGTVRVARVDDGRETLLSQTRLRYPENRWSRLSVHIREGETIGVRLDGEPVLSIPAKVDTYGRIGLYVRNGTASFDNFEIVSAQPEQPSSPEQLPCLSTRSRIADDVLANSPKKEDAGAQSILEWADNRVFWDNRAIRDNPPSAQELHFMLPFYRDFLFEPAPATYPRQWLLRDDADSVVFSFDHDPGHPLRLKRHGNRLWANDQMVAEHPAEKALRLVSSYPGVSAPQPLSELGRGDFLLRSATLFSETFENAPADWFPVSGQWENSSRWQCEPEWTFFSGVAYDDAVLMSKKRYVGDQTHDIVFALKDVLDLRYEGRRYIRRDIGFSFLADSRDVFSGYTVIIGGFGNSGTYLFRGREKIAVNTNVRFSDYKETKTIYDEHTFWRRLRFERRVGRLRVEYEGKTVFDVPEDLETAPRGGALALWTCRNGIMIGRVSSAAESVEVHARPFIFTEPAAANYKHSWRALEPDRVHVRRTRDGMSVARNLFGGGSFAMERPGIANLAQYPALRFYFDIPENVKVSMHVRVNGRLFIYPITAPKEETYAHLCDESRAYGKAHPAWLPFAAAPLEDAVFIGEPQTSFKGVFTFNFLKDMERHFPAAPNIILDRMILGNASHRDYLMTGLSGNPAGAEYKVKRLR